MKILVLHACKLMEASLLCNVGTHTYKNEFSFNALMLKLNKKVFH